MQDEVVYLALQTKSYWRQVKLPQDANVRGD